MKKSHEYDGFQIVTHQIRPGETLSSLAQHYKFPSWKPIWIFNTQVRRVLPGGNPDRISAGVSIFIPLSPAGYDKLIDKLKNLKDQLAGSLDAERYRLEGDYYDFKSKLVLLDLAGDILTTVATVALQACKAAQSAAAARKVVGREAVAAEYLARKEAEKLEEKLWELVVDKGMDGNVDHFKGKMKEESGERLEAGWKGAKSTYKAVKAVRNFSLQGGRFLLDIADIVLDYVKPSTLADGWLWLTTRETSGQSYGNAQEALKKALANGTTQLHDKIVNLEDERDLLYGSSRPHHQVDHRPNGEPITHPSLRKSEARSAGR